MNALPACQHLLAGRTCLVTGASRGLGYRIAQRFWQEGASLWLGARDPESVAALRATLTPAQGQSLAVAQMDLADPESVRTLASRVEGVERLDVLVNCAAVLGPMGPAWKNPADEWAATITADLVSPALLASSVIPWMARRGAGKIINLSGGGATGPRRNFSAYAAAKAGLVRFSETLAEEVRELGISVNCVAPGAMGTDMLASIERAGPAVAGEKEYAAARRAREHAEQTLVSAVELVVFLASSRSDGLTGKLISAVWDNWAEFPLHLPELADSDAYTLRRITGRDRNLAWGDK